MEVTMKYVNLHIKNTTDKIQSNIIFVPEFSNSLKHKIVSTLSSSFFWMTVLVSISVLLVFITK